MSPAPARRAAARIQGLAPRSALALLAVLALTIGPSKPVTPPPAKASAPPATASTPPPPMQADAASLACIKELTDAMGGQETWNKLPYFRFDFVVVKDGKEVARFKHWWDKMHSRCRVEGPDEQGRVVTACFNLMTKKGKTFTDGIVDTDSTNIANIIENGYERWVNDTYWIIMPFKLHDNGVHVKHVRTEEGTNGATYDVLEVSFMPNVGLTPEDHYWLFVNTKTHLIDRWEMVLTGQKPPPSGSTWESWTSIGPLQLSLARRFDGKPVMLRFENVATPATMDNSVFTDSRPKD